MAALKIAYKDPGQLKPRARNPRTHTAKQIKQIAASIKEFGFISPVLIDGADGITLIAAEKTGRRGYGIEIDPHYTDIIIRRFDDVYGLKAVHAESKLDFERLTNERFKEKRHGQKAKNGKGHCAKDR